MGVGAECSFLDFDTIVLCVNMEVTNEHTDSVLKAENIETITIEDGGSMFLQNVVFFFTHKAIRCQNSGYYNLI